MKFTNLTDCIIHVVPMAMETMKLTYLNPCFIRRIKMQILKLYSVFASFFILSTPTNIHSYPPSPRSNLFLEFSKSITSAHECTYDTRFNCLFAQQLQQTETHFQIHFVFLHFVFMYILYFWKSIKNWLLLFHHWVVENMAGHLFWHLQTSYFQFCAEKFVKQKLISNV